MSELSNQKSLLDDIEARQDEVLRRLDDLNLQIEAALKHHTRGQAAVEESSAA